jgi:hypothetical protein
VILSFSSGVIIPDATQSFARRFVDKGGWLQCLMLKLLTQVTVGQAAQFIIEQRHQL